MFRIAACLLLIAVTAALGQNTKQHYIIRIHPARGVAFLEHPTDTEQAAMREHAAYIKRIFDEGKIVAAGPSINGEKTFGLIIVEVGSEAEAREIMSNDPSVKGGIQVGELLPFRLFVARGAPARK